MERTRDVVKWGMEMWISRAMRADVPPDVLDETLRESVRYSAEAQSHTPIEGSETVLILDPNVDIHVRLEHDYPDDVLVAVLTVDCLAA